LSRVESMIIAHQQITTSTGNHINRENQCKQTTRWQCGGLDWGAYGNGSI
jgi:hypothetical protein